MLSRFKGAGGKGYCMAQVHHPQKGEVLELKFQMGRCIGFSISLVLGISMKRAFKGRIDLDNGSLRAALSYP
jgi:hypothetical protein